jgi:hypothetical protein
MAVGYIMAISVKAHVYVNSAIVGVAASQQ